MGLLSSVIVPAIASVLTLGALQHSGVVEQPKASAPVRSAVAQPAPVTPPRPVQAAPVVVLPTSSVQKVFPNTAKGTGAYDVFCTRYPSECAINQSEPATIRLTPEVWTALTTVNTQVNHAIKPVDDQDHWGVVDRWDFAEDGKGDCEDYQLLKRRTLREKYGLPQRAMRMTVVYDETGAGHAVLTVLTDRGDFILDNRTDTVRSWSETARKGYVFIKREGSDSQDWVALAPNIGTRRVTTTTPNR